jgi:hypothetical protein
VKVGGRRTLRAFGIALIATLGFSVSARAAGPKEFFLNSAGLELLGGANRISIAPGLNYGIYDWLQVGGGVSYQTVAFGDDSVNTLTAFVGPTFDLGGPYANATFIFFGYAYRKGSGEVSDPLNDPGGSGLVFMVGRRIPLFGGLAYRPSVGMQLAGKTTFVINALAVSYLF